MTQIDKTNGTNQPVVKQNSNTSQNVKRDTTASQSDSIFNNTKIIVQNGETPESLGKTFGVSSQDIINQNKDKWNGKWFKVGQEITLPTQIDSKDERLTGRAKTKQEAEAGWLDYKKGNTKTTPTNQNTQQPVQKFVLGNNEFDSGALVGSAIGKAAIDSLTKAKTDTTKTQQTTVQKSPDKAEVKAKENNSAEPKSNTDFSALNSGAQLGSKIGQAISNPEKADTAKTQPKLTPVEPLLPSQLTKTPDTSDIKLRNTAQSQSSDKTIDKATQTELKDQHGGIDTKRTNRNKKAEGDIVYHKDGSVTISDRVDKRIQQMAQNIKCSPDDLKGLLFKESRFEINGKGTAAGLNQMTKDGLAGLNRKYGTNFSKKDIRRMDVMQQLDIAEASLMLSKEEKFGTDRRVNAGQLFALNLYPAGANRNNVITSAHGAAYSSNKGLDKNKDGIISMNELQVEIMNNAKHVHTELT